MTQIVSSKMSRRHIEQISHLQQSIWDLEKACTKIDSAIGNSELGKIYIKNIKALIEDIQDDIDNIHDEYTQ